MLDERYLYFVYYHEIVSLFFQYSTCIMKIHSTNYFNTFIEVAEDTKVDCGIKPPTKDIKTVAEMQYELIVKSPYKFTSDDVLFQVYADRKGVAQEDYQQFREEFFSKGQPCFRASSLTKNYGFGVHYDSAGKIAIYGMETPEYQKCILDPKLKKLKAMKTNK